MTATELSANTLAKLAGKYLTFRLGNEGYAIPVLDVREIIRHTDITPVPHMPTHVKGVINLRGKIIPVTDLRLRLGLPEAPVTDVTCVIVVQVPGVNQQPILMGLIVDAVEAVVQIHTRDLEPPPELGTGCVTAGLLAMAKLDRRVLALLDTRTLVSLDGAYSTSSPPTPEH
ncbi:MAG: chemotaxis protein CheW [Verrucomicrobiota bacterium]|nr:chemotaxis protein CheW [Limisphaera sp.]MDW8380899.1 chemotaxis protein CheW [Verrucomicrobiota bacterium]